MIQFTTHNNENQIVVGVPNDAYDFQCNIWSDNSTTLEFYSETFEMEYDSFEFNLDGDKQLKEITISFDPINLQILGTFDKSKNEIDFLVDKNAKASYLSLLQSVTKESKKNKFVILKQIEK